MYLLLAIGIGGFIGAIMRYAIGGLIQKGFLSFPFGTLVVNFLGSFFLSLIMYLSRSRIYLNEEMKLFITVGILGAFTTMSTFSYESFRLLEQDKIVMFSVNVIGTVFLTMLAIYLGRFVATSSWRI